VEFILLFFPLFVSREREKAPPPPHPIAENHLPTPEQQVVLSVNNVCIHMLFYTCAGQILFVILSVAIVCISVQRTANACFFSSLNGFTPLSWSYVLFLKLFFSIIVKANHNIIIYFYLKHFKYRETQLINWLVNLM